MSELPKLLVLACSVFEKEIELHRDDAEHLVDVRMFEMGLHDRPDVLRSTLQEEIDRLDRRDDFEVLVLAYGLCGCGTAGLSARRHRLVIPRGHDCITVFMGGKERYAAHQKACPSCFYYTPGWNRGRRVPGPGKIGALRRELSKRFDQEDVKILLDAERESWGKNDTVTYLDLGTEDAEREADYAERCAEWLGWRFERLRGDASLLRDLLWARWDESRFQVLEPGEVLAHSADDRIMRAAPRRSTE